MLISLKQRFIFIANTKTGSTSVEQRLKRFAEIAILHQRYGKHLPYTRAVMLMKPILEHSNLEMDAFFRFGVIREPVSWVLSWYNYQHRRQLSSDDPRCCRGISFEEFVEEVISGKDCRPFAKIGRQARRFNDGAGKLGVDHLIPLPQLDSQFDEFCDSLGIGWLRRMRTRRLNKSPKVQPLDAVPTQLRETLEGHFAEDVELYERAMRGDFGNLVEGWQKKRAAAP